jgi:hypothetical protein
METETYEITKAGSLLMLDVGSYSDYTVVGFFLVLETFNTKEQMSEYLKSLPKLKVPKFSYPYSNSTLSPKEVEKRQKEWWLYRDSLPNHNKLLAFLLAKGLLLEIEYKTLSIDRFDSEKFIPIKTIKYDN